MKKPVKVTVRVAAELAAASAIMISAGAFAFGGAASLASSDTADTGTTTVMAYKYSPAL